MEATPGAKAAPGSDQDWANFAGLSRLSNHWDRPNWWPGRTAYYWYLTFRESSDLREMAAKCQSAIDGPHLDLVPPDDIHMTLERIAFEDEISEDGLASVAVAAQRVCQDLRAFELTVGPLAGSKGAISFSASPRGVVGELRSRLVDATRSVGYAGGSADPDWFRPHVGIAYCNQEIDARPVVREVAMLRELPLVRVPIYQAHLVALTRRDRSYSWESLHRVMLSTASNPGVD